MELFVFALLVLSKAAFIFGWEECGLRGPRNRVVGGHEAGRGEWPWQVYLKHQKDHSSSSFGCGGTILDKDWVLTAAHCVYEDRDTSSYTITVGDHNINRVDPYEVKHSVQRIVIHQGYNRWSNKNDIALLKMAKSIDFKNAAVSPACLPKVGQNNEGQFCHISGWGFTWKSQTDFWDENLQTVGSKIWQFTDCKRVWSDVRENYQVCFGDGKVNGCMGDSGGPLSCEQEDGKYIVAGVTSYGDGECTNPGVPAVWTKVSGYLDFIKENTGLTAT